MMESAREYLLAIVAACMIAVLANAMIRNRTVKRVVRFVGGILVILAVVTPLLSLDADRLTAYLDFVTEEYGFDSVRVEKTMQEQLALHIKQTTETYIEQKASELGATVQAEVTLDEGTYPVPVHATVVGTLTPEQMSGLAAFMQDSLGIPTEEQEWKGYG